MRRSVSIAVYFVLTACSRGTDGNDRAKQEPVAKPAAGSPVSQPSSGTSELRSWTFDDTPTGAVPDGIRIAQTGKDVASARWAVRADASAPSAPNVYGVIEAPNEGQYNLAILEGTRLRNLDAQVMVRAVAGERDRGGGLAFRVAGPDDYYVARWNPLEKNARFYVVQGGHRTALAKADLDLDPDAWHALRVVGEGPQMELYLDDRLVLRIEDGTLERPGAIGLWTKTDALTFFDDITATAL